MSDLSQDLPSYGADFIATDDQRRKLDERRERFGRETPWTMEGIEITDETSLLGALMTRSARDLAWTRDCIESGLRDELAELIADHQSMLAKIIKLCSQDWSPSPFAILDQVEPRMARLERMYDHHCRAREAN